jgi:hypothetical protein
MENGVGEGFNTLDAVFRSGNIGDATRLIDAFRTARGAEQIRAGSEEVAQIIQCLSRFEETAQWEGLSSSQVSEWQSRSVSAVTSFPLVVDVPGQDKVKAIKS